MPKSDSAGLLMYSKQGELRVLLAHPGGPYFAKKDEGAWTIPKGLTEAGEFLLAAAKREFVEETGYELSSDATFLPLGSVQLTNQKVVHGWAFEGEWRDGHVPQSNTFCLEWPPRSGKMQEFPEIDRAEMFCVEQAKRRINQRQLPFVDRLTKLIK